MEVAPGNDLIAGARKTANAAKGGRSLLTTGELTRIENAATRINKSITVVGSRASGEARAYSDLDYVIEGGLKDSREWSKIKNSLPVHVRYWIILPEILIFYQDQFGLTIPTLQFILINYFYMLRTDKAITINQYGQGLINSEILIDEFLDFELIEKRNYLKEIIALILQSKPQEEDIQPAILESKLRATYTPCVLLTKGISNHHLQKIVELPETELKKALLLLLGLFKISYQRRFQAEKNNPGKWWYWDLSDQNNIKRIESTISDYN